MITEDCLDLANEGVHSFEGETFGAVASFHDLGGGTKVWATFRMDLSFCVLVFPNKEVNNIPWG